MKKYILGAVLSLGILISPAFVSSVEAATLTTEQATSLIELVKASPSTPASAFVSLITSFSKITTEQATSLIGLVKASPSTPTSNFVDVILTFANDTSSSNPTATFTVNGQTSVTGVDPMVARTWAWSGTTGGTYTASGILSECDDTTQNGAQSDWKPWTVGTGVAGTASSGSAVAIPGASKYGCKIVGTYTVTKDGKTTSATATITFKHANSAGTYNLTVTKAGTGTGTVNRVILSDSSLNSVFPNGIPVSFSSGSSVVIDATPSSGSTFAGWSGSCNGTPTTCTVSMSSDKSVTANFTQISGASTYNLSFTKVGSGDVSTNIANTSCTSPTCSGFQRTIPNGTSVTLTATPVTGFTFTGWSGGTCSGTASTCTFTMSSSKNVTATFTSTNLNVTCTGWTYSDWSPSTCPSSGIQTRTYSTSSPTAPTPAGCTGGSPTTTRSCSYTPPVVISCTGTPPPAGTGVVVNGYTNVSAGGGGITSSNTVWQYGAYSCGWSCAAPMERNGDVGCKNPAPGSGTTITLNDLSTGGKLSGIALNPQTIIGLSGAAAIGLGGTNGVFTTGSDGKTPEFWLTDFGSTGWTVVVVPIQGYKIRSATGCAFDVSIHANQTNNRCTGIKNGTPVTINMVPGNIATVPTTVFPKSTFNAGENLTGTVIGGNPKDTWGCMDSPNTVTGHECTSGWTNVWRKLTVPYDGHADGWHLVETNYGDTIELSPMATAGFPAGSYTSYVKTGQWGTPGQTSSTRFTLTASQGTVINPPQAQGTYTLTVAKSGNGSGSVASSGIAGIACTTGYSASLCSASYPAGTHVPLVANPLTGDFGGWSGACSGMGGCEVIMSSNQTVTANFTSSGSAAPHIVSISPSSTSAGVAMPVTVTGSGFTGTNDIYMDNVLIDATTQSSSGGSTPTWISFVVPTFLPSCPSWNRFCVPGPALQVGTHTVSVRNSNGTSNSLSFVVH